MNFLDIKSETDLKTFLGVNDKLYRFLKYGDPNKKYIHFTIAKKTGGDRNIYSPIPCLKNIHQVLKNEFDTIGYVHYSAHGFAKSKSTKSNADLHKGHKVIVNIDLANFFESIHIGRLIGLFSHKPFFFPKNVSTAIAQILCFGDHLIQGSPCSPILSNMVFYRTDKEITKYIRGKSIQYSRYADDITFSFDNKSNLSLFFTSNKEINKDFIKILENAHFKINDKKTRVQMYYMHQEVTGIKVNDYNRLNLNRGFKYKIRGLLHALQKYGIEETSKEFAKRNSVTYDKNKTVTLLCEVLRGEIAYYGMVRGKSSRDYIKLAMDYNSIFSSKPIFLETDDCNIIENNCILFVETGGIFHGSAFFYKGYIVTCIHCVEDKANIGSFLFYSNKMQDNHKKRAELVAKDEKNDIAILKPVGYSKIVNISPSLDKPIIGDRIKALGYPDYTEEAPFNLALIDGTLTTIRHYKSKEIFVTSAPMQTGISGGPILDNNNRLIGIACLGNTDMLRSKIENGFVSASQIDSLIKKYEEKD